MKSIFSARPAWAEINLDYIAHNVRQIKKLVGSGTEIMAVVKADGYGFGAAEVAVTALEAGATNLAVAFVEEGIDLRKAGIAAPVLLFGYTDSAQFSTLVEHQLTPTIFGIDTAVEFSRLAVDRGIVLPAHIKIDTGMGRLGLLPEEVLEVVTRIKSLPGLKIEGFYTHFAAAEDEDRTYSEEQLLLFNRVIAHCREKGINFPVIHSANSAATLAYPAAWFDLVRVGILLYGYYPSPFLKESSVELLPALTLKSKIVLVKKVPQGTAIGYSCTYYTEQESLIATIPIGYDDGYNRLLSNRGHVLIRGQRAPVVGRISMDHLMADVTGIPGARRGDEVVLYGRQGNNQISVEEVADQVGTINYELLCAIDKRVSRLYFRQGKLISIHDFIGNIEIQPK